MINLVKLYLFLKYKSYNNYKHAAKSCINYNQNYKIQPNNSNNNYYQTNNNIILKSLKSCNYSHKQLHKSKSKSVMKNVKDKIKKIKLWNYFKEHIKNLFSDRNLKNISRIS